MDASNYGSGLPDPQPIEREAAALPASAAPPPPNTKAGKAVRFGLALVPRGPLVVAKIHPNRSGAEGRTFNLPEDWRTYLAWVEANEGEYNLHFNPNAPVAPELQKGENGRPKASDFAFIRMLVTDIDPPPNIETQPGGLAGWRKDKGRELAKLVEDPNGPSGFIDSGGGYQLIWLLLHPLPNTPENETLAKAQSRGLAARFGGDATHDIGHLFRLPFTDNLPNEAKRRRGRTRASTWGIVFDNPRRLHTLDGLAALAPPIEDPSAPTEAPPFDTDLAWEVSGNPNALPIELAERLATARAEWGPLDKILNAEPPETGSRLRSGHDFGIACACAAAGITDPAEVAAIVVAYSPAKFEDEEDTRGRPRADRYLTLTVNRALARVARKAAREAALLAPIEDEADSAPTAAETFDGEPLDIFGHDDLIEASTSLVDALPAPIGRHVRALAARMGTPESFAAVVAVAVLAAAIGGALKLQVREHDTEFQVTAPILVVIVGRPGRKKSPLVKALTKALRKIDAELHARSAAQWADWRAKHCSAKGTPKPGAPPPPAWQQVIVDNATIEKLIAIIADNPGGLLIDPDELMALLGSLDAYKRNGGGDRGLLLRITDGGAVSLERKSGSTRAQGAPVGMSATTQPDKIRTLTRDLGTDGFLQRLIFVTDDGIEREPLDAPSDPESADEYERVVRGMFDIRHAGGGTVYLSPEARMVLTATWRQIRALQALPGASAAWEGHISKWEGFLYRIALTFHALDTWSFLDAVPTGPEWPVAAETARRASRFARALVGHALRFYGEYYEPAEHNAEAREVAGYLLAHPDKTSFSPREIEEVRRPLQGNRRLTLATMGELERFGWLSVAERAADGPARWAINPRIHERFSERAEREKLHRSQQQARISAALSARRGLNDDL